MICPSCCFVAVRHEVSACTGSDTVPGEPNVCSKIRPSIGLCNRWQWSKITMRSYGRDRGLFRICERPEETAPARRRSSRGGRACQKFDRMGRFSITKTERPRSANLLQMPRGLMCKLRQRGRDYGGPAGSRGIDPSLQPRSRRSNCLDSPLWRLWTGGIIPATQPRIQAKPQFRLRLSGFRHWCRAVRWPVSIEQWRISFQPMSPAGH